MEELNFTEWCEKYYDENSLLTAELQYDAYLDELGDIAYEEFRDREER